MVSPVSEYSVRVFQPPDPTPVIDGKSVEGPDLAPCGLGSARKSLDGKSIRENPRSEVDLMDSGHVILEVHYVVENQIGRAHV